MISGDDLFKWNVYRPYKSGLETVLSPLEAEVLELMWKEKRATARTIYTRLKARRNINRTTVNATMSSLAKRGLLSSEITRGKGGLKYVYTVKISRREFENDVVGKVVESLLESFGEPARKLIQEKVK